MVLDSCIKEVSGQIPCNVAELVEAWRTLDEARSHSPIAVNLLDQSMQLLRKYSPNHTALAAFTMQSGTVPTALAGTASWGSQGLVMEYPSPSLIPGPDITFVNSQWQEYEARMGWDKIDWNKLLNNVDGQFLFS